jgi:hypothetical protein
MDESAYLLLPLSPPPIDNLVLASLLCYIGHDSPLHASDLTVLLTVWLAFISSPDHLSFGGGIELCTFCLLVVVVVESGSRKE